MPSIYRPKDPSSGSDVDGRSPAHVVRESVPDPQVTSDEQSVWAGRRKAQPANILLPGTRRWLELLPAEYRPYALAEQYPRILNLIAAHWHNPRDCSAFISSLLHDQRGGRRGFGADVSRDILNLRMCYTRLHPIIDWEPQGGAQSHSQLWNPPASKR